MAKCVIDLISMETYAEVKAVIIARLCWYNSTKATKYYDKKISFQNK